MFSSGWTLFMYSQNRLAFRTYKDVWEIWVSMTKYDDTLSVIETKYEKVISSIPKNCIKPLSHIQWKGFRRYKFNSKLNSHKSKLTWNAWCNSSCSRLLPRTLCRHYCCYRTVVCRLCISYRTWRCPSKTTRPECL